VLLIQVVVEQERVRLGALVVRAGRLEQMPLPHTKTWALRHGRLAKQEVGVGHKPARLVRRSCGQIIWRLCRAARGVVALVRVTATMQAARLPERAQCRRLRAEPQRRALVILDSCCDFCKMGSRYSIRSIILSGGQAEVAQARLVRLERPVAAVTVKLGQAVVVAVVA